MDFLPPDISAYADAHTSPESELLRQLNRNTYARVLYPRMLSGHMQGRLLSMYARMLRPRRILEIGTFTGYSALCLAEGLADDGVLITIEKDDELESFARSYWNQSPVGHLIDLRIGHAVELVPTLDGPFDLVFIDADKENYSLYYDLVFDKVRTGGIILADNVLWSGKVVKPVGNGRTAAHRRADKDTQHVLDFNRKVNEDPRVEQVLLPVRDGLMMIYKK
ncbi:putative O-methyltransferase YrrM [Larkinella arboricola]|uniref:Putative O-methyltransferase YrrM n=1 Tax=Larkinella arboricola TaxID=643671 RepID=A0A327WRX4_LARAB|nr:O-methyltransferase [Larkinella arboricola]RAJ95482.1 putative O-methyltransferase YrrM [Larkinella arboricola]